VSNEPTYPKSKKKWEDVLTDEQYHMVLHWVEAFVDCRVLGNPELLIRYMQSEESAAEVKGECYNDFIDTLLEVADATREGITIHGR